MPEARRGTSRAALLRTAAAATGAAAAGTLAAGLRPERADSAPSPSQDVRILNYLLFMEELQAAFYARASSASGLTAALGTFAAAALDQERAHIALLRKVLGSRARKRPSFGLEGLTDGGRFGGAAVLLEEAAVSTYIGQVANLTAPAMTKVVGLISVEARQAAWIRDVVGQLPAPSAADSPKSVAESLRALERAGFEVGNP